MPWAANSALQPTRRNDEHLPPEQRSKEIGYVEHLLKQFGSITYYGNKK